MLCQSLCFHVSKVLFMKSFCLDNATWLLNLCLLSIIDNFFWITSLISCALHYYFDQDYVIEFLIKKYLFYHLPTRGRVGVKLGDADTCQTYQ